MKRWASQRALGTGGVFARGALREYGVAGARSVLAADSFAGLPPPDAASYPVDKVDLSYTQTDLAVSLEEVRGNFRRYQLLDREVPGARARARAGAGGRVQVASASHKGVVEFVKGFFEETMPVLAARAGFGPLAVLRMDGDMYGSTWVVLEHMYRHLSVGGYIIVDDFCLRTCRMAILDFREKHGITEPIWRADWCGVYWKKGRHVHLQ